MRQYGLDPPCETTTVLLSCACRDWQLVRKFIPATHFGRFRTTTNFLLTTCFQGVRGMERKIWLLLKTISTSWNNEYIWLAWHVWLGGPTHLESYPIAMFWLFGKGKNNTLNHLHLCTSAPCLTSIPLNRRKPQLKSISQPPYSLHFVLVVILQLVSH